MSSTPSQPGDSSADAQRWRLVLGKFADSKLGSFEQQDSRDARMDRCLDYLYGREYQGRGIRQDRQADQQSRRGGSQSSVLSVPDWLNQVRELFPSDTVEVIHRHALSRYGMTELVTDAEVLQAMEPNYELLKAVLAFKGMMSQDVLDVARTLVRHVVEELTRKLARDIRQKLWGKLNKQRRSRLKVLRNLDWQRTIRDNLKNYDPDRKQIVLGAMHFFSRVDHHLPWHIIMAVDNSGSMTDSVIHSAVMAGIFKSLPALQVSLITFDTSVVDLSEQVDDATELLMSVQLGGGTDIDQAMRYCESLVRSPTRTIVVLVTDFYEGGDPVGLVTTIKSLCSSGVRVIGLAALDATAEPSYDRDMAEECVAAGAEVAALTPQRLAEWLSHILS